MSHKTNKNENAKFNNCNNQSNNNKSITDKSVTDKSIKKILEKTFDTTPMKNKDDLLGEVIKQVEASSANTNTNTQTDQSIKTNLKTSFDKKRKFRTATVCSLITVVLISLGIIGYPFVKNSKDQPENTNPTNYNDNNKRVENNTWKNNPDDSKTAETSSSDTLMQGTITPNPALSVKVYASSSSDEQRYSTITSKTPVKIDTNFDPLSSSSTGVGIHFEFEYPQGEITIIAEHGTFKNWNQEGDGTISDLGNKYVFMEKGDIYWSPTFEELSTLQTTHIKVMVMDQGVDATLATIKITKEDDGRTFSADLENLTRCRANEGTTLNIDQLEKDFDNHYSNNQKN